MYEVKAKPFTLSPEETRMIQQKLETIGTVAAKAGDKKLTGDQEKQIDDAYQVIASTFTKEGNSKENGMLPTDLQREGDELYQTFHGGTPGKFGTGKEVLAAVDELVSAAQHHGLKLEEIAASGHKGKGKADAKANAIIASYDAFVRAFNPGHMSREQVHREIDKISGLVKKSDFLPPDKRRITDALDRAKDLASIKGAECDWQVAWMDFRQGVADAMERKEPVR
jgi:hypothetical protein